MLQLISHRGPDGSAEIVDHPSAVVLGHTRLAINGLGPSGSQPIISSDGQHILTVSGEFYGFRETRALLAAEGESFTSKSDSAVALALYRKHGLRFLRYLRGDFALALFDRRQNRLILARDRFGVRPLFFYRNGKLIVWASEAKSVLAHPSVPRRLCRRAGLGQLVQVTVPGTTLFEGVCAVKPGQVVVVDRRQGRLVMRKEKYWDLEFPFADGYAGAEDPASHVEAVRRATIEALMLRSDADVPIGFHLSGGLDSGSLLGLAAQAMPSRPQAFTVAFQDPIYDESAVARRVATHTDSDLRVLGIADKDLYGESFRAAVWHSERSFYNTLGVAKMHLSKFVRSAGFKAVITGEGADELFSGYPAFRLDYPDVLRSQTENATQPGSGSPNADDPFIGAILPMQRERHVAFERVCGFTPGWVQPWVSTWRAVQPLLDRGLLGEVADFDPLGAVAEELDQSMMDGRHPLDIAQYSWIKTMLDGQILSWGGDRVDMANSVESRPVFLDHHLAEVAVSVPPELRLRNGREKWVLREAMRGVLSDEIYRRRKFAFMAPPAHRSPERRQLLRQLVDQHLSEQRLAEVGLCDAARTRAFLAAATDGGSSATRNEADKICNHLLCIHLVDEQLIQGRERERGPWVEQP